MKNPVKTVFLNHTGQKILLRLETKIMTDVLVLDFTSHELLKVGTAATIEDTLKRNIESDIVSNQMIATKQLNAKKTCLLSDIEEYTRQTGAMVNEYISKQDQQIKLNLFNISFFVPYEKLCSIHNIFTGFINTYDLIKLQLMTPETEVDSKVSPDIKIERELINKDIINMIFTSCSNKIMNYYIIKWINCNTNTNMIKFNIKEEEELNIEVSELFDYELYSYNVNNYNDLDNILTSISIDREVNIEKLKNLFGFLSNLIKQKDEIDNDSLCVYIQIITFLMFVYTYKTFQPGTVLKDVPDGFKVYYTTAVNWCIRNIIQKFPIEYKSINVKFIKTMKDDNSDNKSSILDKISTVSQKYNYLVKIDEDVFVDKIFNDIPSDDPNSFDNIKLDNRAFIGSPKIINIRNFFGSDPSNILLSYSNIDVDKYDFGSNIITQEYFDILVIESGEKFKRGHKPGELVSKYANIIINDIFKKINKSKELAEWGSINTLILLNEFIIPFIGEETSEKTKREILYRILIPHMYNVYGTKEIIDYFH
jgi:hypothetical protein